MQIYLISHSETILIDKVDFGKLNLGKQIYI